MKWTTIIERGLVGNIPKVKIAKISQPRKAEGGYFFDLHIKLADGKRGIWPGLFITSEFIMDSDLKTSDVFVDIIQDDLYKMKNSLTKMET